MRNTQTLPLAILTIAWDGAVTTFSPELIDAPSKEHGDFILGNIFTDSIADLSVRPSLCRWQTPSKKAASDALRIANTSRSAPAGLRPISISKTAVSTPLKLLSVAASSRFRPISCGAKLRCRSESRLPRNARSVSHDRALTYVCIRLPADDREGLRVSPPIGDRENVSSLLAVSHRGRTFYGAGRNFARATNQSRTVYETLVRDRGAEPIWQTRHRPETLSKRKRGLTTQL